MRFNIYFMESKNFSEISQNLIKYQRSSYATKEYHKSIWYTAKFSIIKNKIHIILEISKI